MDEIISYRAADGKIFANKDECFEYEKVLAIKEFFHKLFDTYSIYNSVNEEDFIEEILAKRSILKAIL